MLNRVLVLLLVPASLACHAFEQKACTTRGCQDQASITVRRPDWNPPPFAVELDLDGRRVTCPAPMARSAGGIACDDPSVRVAHRELSDCTESRSGTNVSLTCVPNGKLEQVITIVGTPKRIVATLTADGAVAGQRNFDMTYTAVYPNGPDCDPGCKQRSEVWDLP
jgi:hypothetical protein